MLVIYKNTNGHIFSVWTDGENNNIETIYPNNPEYLNMYSSIIIPYNQNVLDNHRKYRILENEIKLKPVFDLSIISSNLQLNEVTQLTISQKENFEQMDNLSSLDLLIFDKYNPIVREVLPFPNLNLTIDLDFNNKGEYNIQLDYELYNFNTIGVIVE